MLERAIKDKYTYKYKLPFCGDFHKLTSWIMIKVLTLSTYRMRRDAHMIKKYAYKNINFQMCISVYAYIYMHTNRKRNKRNADAWRKSWYAAVLGGWLELWKNTYIYIYIAAIYKINDIRWNISFIWFPCTYIDIS